MNTVNKVLLGALVVQTALTAITRWPSGGGPEQRDLLGFEVDELAAITITGRKAADEVPQPPIELRREGEGWVIASEEGFPVDADMLQPTLDMLGSLRARAPIATSAASHKNLEVADDAFTRMLVVESSGGEKQTLYVGAGSGKSAHVRVEGEEEVYDVLGFNAWSLSENANRYFERDILTLPLAEVSALTLSRPGAPPLEFSKAEDGTWTATGLVESGLPPEAALDQAATTGWLSRVLTLRMADPAGRQERPEMGLDDASATVVTWTHGDPPQSGSYRVGAPIAGQNGRVWLRFDELPFVLEAMETNLQAVLAPDLEALAGLKAPEPQRPPPTMGGAGGPHGGGMPPGGGGPHGGGMPGGGGPHGGAGGGGPHGGGGAGHP
jgi:hypothetical protein